MLDLATKFAALVVLVVFIAIVLSVLSLIFCGVVFALNRIASATKPVPIPSFGKAIVFTGMSIFVNSVLWVGSLGIASLLSPGPVITALLALGSVIVGSVVMARIVADILPASFGRALAIMLTATICQFAMYSVAWKQVLNVSDTLLTIIAQ